MSQGSTIVKEPDEGGPRSAGAQLALGLLFGIAFGFLLQKGGVAKFHILIGVLLLEDFTVVQVMLSAIIVGMLGIFALHHFGLVELHVKPTRYLANVLGGVLFGIGFGLSAYCPGTSAAALGQGNFDALAVITGMMVGSYLFAEASGVIERSVNPVGDRGKLTLPELIHAPRWPFIVVFAVVLASALAGIEFINQ
ncbi:MAG: YeeE/YedE thiosulfate transporter family protein [Phycisphaerales bacterium]